MTRVQPNKNPSPKAQLLLEDVRRMLGSTPNLFTTLAHSPAALGVFVNALGAFADSDLSPALREQIALTVAGANGCDYCASVHTALGKRYQVNENELVQNLEAGSSDHKTRAALAFARKIVDARGNVSDPDVQAVRAAGFSDSQIVDIVAVTCVNIFTNYFNHVMGTEIDFPLVKTEHIAKAV